MTRTEQHEAALEIIDAMVEDFEFAIDDYKQTKNLDDWYEAFHKKEIINKILFAYRSVDIITREEVDQIYKETEETLREA